MKETHKKSGGNRRQPKFRPNVRTAGWPCTNEDRAVRGGKLLGLHIGLLKDMSQPDDPVTVESAITDLLHFAHCLDMNVSAVARNAVANWKAER